LAPEELKKNPTYIENKQWILRGHDLRGAVVRNLCGLLVPPLVAALCPRNFIACPLEDEHVLDAGALFDCCVCNDFCRDRLPATTAFIRSDEHAGLAVVHPVAERLRAKPGEHDRVYSADAGTREESSDGLPSHRQIHRDRVALLDAERFENIGDAADFAEQFGVCDLTAFVWFVCFVNDCRLEESRSEER
jgi:hypothetical protein